MAAKVLVVEDDNFLIKAYTAKLTSAGFELQTARDGQEALEVLKTFRPDVILLDLVMPVKDGFETLADIKKDPNLNKIPVIVASNLAQEEDIARATSLGATDMITKSNLSLEDLIKKLHDITGK